MTHGAPGSKYQLCTAWRRLLGCLLGSRASTWLETGIILDVATASLYFAWLLSFLMWGGGGAGVDGLTCHLHRRMDCGCQAWIPSLQTGVVSSHCLAQVGVVSDPLSRGCEAPGMGPPTWC
jgi:hypothetical protein